jgi:hypothetical protein
VNAYNLEIARKRARTFIEHAIDLLTNHTVNPQYPGIVFALGGDMFSGDSMKSSWRPMNGRGHADLYRCVRGSCLVHRYAR